MVKLSFHGAAGEVTGSNFLIEGTHRYIVDCGLFQGERESAELNTEQLPYNAGEVDAVIITHAHLDHVGRLPQLKKEGYKGPIFGTEATLELTAIVLQDAYEIMLHRQERNGAEPLYSQADLRRTLDSFQPIPYHKTHHLLGQDTVTLYDAGHILGSSSVQIEVDGKKIVFSGDVGHAPSVLLPKPDDGFEADVVVTEGTYGGREREDTADRLAILKEGVTWIQEHRGVLIIPAFSIERSQELLYLFNDLFNTHKLPKIPIYLDSPLAIEALRVFERHQELYNKEVQKVRQTDSDVFSFRGLALTSSVDQSKMINDEPPPKIIIAGSGMMEGGRIHHHLKHYLGWPNTYLMVVGYQAQGTFGSRLLQKPDSVMIMGEKIPVRARIEKVDVFSGHADNSELIDWLHGVRYRENAKIYIVHSELEHATTFKANIEHAIKDVTVTVPALGDTVEL